jgi:hypothetical protein
MWLHQKDPPKHSQIWNWRPIAVAATIIPRVSRAVNENRVTFVRLVLYVEWSIEVTKASLYRRRVSVEDADARRVVIKSDPLCRAGCRSI